MAYIKKEPIIEFITKGLNNPDKAKAFGHDAIEILTEIEFSPPEDVVPKSEVEAIMGWFELLKTQIAEAKQEVAMEIFEEILKTMNSVYASVQHSMVGMHGDNPETMRMLGKLEGIKYLGDEIAELKKKYTESGGQYESNAENNI